MHGCSYSGKNSSSMKKWMAQGDPPKEVNTIKKINGWSLLLSSNKMTHHFKEWTTPGGVLKNIYIIFTKVCCFKQILFNSTCSHYSSAIENSTLWRKQLFRKPPLQMQMSTIALLTNLLYLMNSCNCCCEIEN